MTHFLPDLDGLNTLYLEDIEYKRGKTKDGTEDAGGKGTAGKSWSGSRSTACHEWNFAFAQFQATRSGIPALRGSKEPFTLCPTWTIARNIPEA